MNDIHTNNAYMQQIQMYTLYLSKTKAKIILLLEHKAGVSK